MNHLAVYAGASARRVIEKEGWQPEIFNTMVGASGGAKFLALGHLDKFLFGDFLQRSQHPMHLIGSSIGTWRHAALTQPDPVSALEKLQQGYIHQDYQHYDKITPEVVSEVSLDLLDKFLTPDKGAKSLCGHSRFRSHIVTARGKGPTASARAAVQGMGLGLAAISNSVHRSAMQIWFQRVVFSSVDTQGHGFPFGDFSTRYEQLTPANTRQALHASGSIPFVLTGERDITGAAPGQYWDGGIIDYHFDFTGFANDGLVLYPHFRGDVTPGWFDKFLPWRKAKASALSNVVLLCPSEAYVAQLTGGKIPDRRDFPKMTQEERIKTWQAALDASTTLAEDFSNLISGDDPLRGVQSF